MNISTFPLSFSEEPVMDQIRGDDAQQHVPEPAAAPIKPASSAPDAAPDNGGHLRDRQGRKLSVPVEDLDTSNDGGAG